MHDDNDDDDDDDYYYYYVYLYYLPPRSILVPVRNIAHQKSQEWNSVRKCHWKPIGNFKQHQMDK